MELSDKITLYRSRFQVRPDVYATLVHKDGRRMYFPECGNKFTRSCLIGKRRSPCTDCPDKTRAPLTDEVIAEHITGRKIHGFYLLFPDGTCKVAVLDFDEEHSFQDVEEIVFYARKFGLNPYPATSTSKGWHIYFFMDKPIQAGVIRACLRYVCTEAGIKPLPEIFPKQSRASDLGNLIRTPLTEPDVKRGRCAFLNPENGYRPFDLEVQWEFLKTINPCSATQVESFVSSLKIEHICTKESNPELYPKMMKSCVRRALAVGSEEGRRNNVGHIIATELKRLDDHRDRILRSMRAWNNRNVPPLSEEELLNIIDSACEKEYSYGCRSEEVRDLMDCVGYDDCEYYKEYRKVKIKEEWMTE